MKLIITGSLGNVGKPLTQQLIASGHEVTVITSQYERKQSIEALGAKAAVGSIADEAFLTQVFTGADAVFAMTPPGYGNSPIVANITRQGETYATAFKQAGIERVVMLSSLGAHLAGGNGPIEAIHNIENIYRSVVSTSFTFLRAGYFYLNFLADIPMIKNAGIEGSNFSTTSRIPLVHPLDIARAAAEELVTKQKGNKVRYIVSDIRTGADIAKVLGTAIGNPALPWVEFSDAQAIEGMTNAGLPQELAGLFAAMGAGLRNGSIQGNFIAQGSPVTGSIKLESFAEEFANAFGATAAASVDR